MMRDWAAPGGRTVLVKALPPGKDRADFTEFLRENHSFGFEHVKFDTDEGISILYDTHQNAKFALDSITQSTAIDITWAAQDLIPDPSLLSSRALHAVEPNPVVYIEPALTPLSPDEVKKLLMAYRGCESFDIISKEELNYDRDRGVGRAPHQGRASSARFYYYALFRDVFCAETAIEDLNKCIGIPATYARNHERVRNILEGKVARLGTAATPAPATPRNNSAMLTWIHVAEIPTDVDFAKLRAHFGRLEGFRCLSFQPNGVLLGFATEPYAKRAAEMLLKNTRMDVNPATPDAVQTVQQVTTAMAVSQPATTLCVHLTPYAPVHRVSEMVHVYAGVQEVKPDAAHVYVRFASLDESVRAVTDLEATTDLALEFVPGFGVAKDHNLGVLSPTGTTPARPASTHPGGGLVTAAGLPTRPRTTRADSTISTASSAAATPFPHQHQHPTDHHGAISISPFDTTTVLMASHPTPTPPSHYDPRYLSDAAIFISAKDLPHVKFSLRHSVGTLDGFTRMAFQEEGFYAWFTTRDHAAKAVGRLEGEKHITPTLIKRPQTRTPHAPHPMRPLTAEHYQGALFVRCPWALTLDGLQCILEAYPGYMTCRHLRDAIIVDYVNHEVAEKVVRDLQETTNIRVEWSTRSAQPGNRYMVDDAGDEAAHERRYSAPRPMEPLARPAFAPAQTSRTLVVSTAVPVDKADTRAIVAKLPGFSRVRFQGINFHIAFQTPELAAQALPLIKRSQPAWKASAAKTDIPPLPEQLAAVQEAKNPKPPPSTVLEIANAGWTEAECIKLLESFHGFESVDYDSDTSRAYFSDGRTCQRACVDINSTTDLVAAYEKRGEDRLAGQGLSFVGAAAAAAKVLREGGGHAEEGPVMVHNAEPADVVVHAWKQQPAPDTTTTPPTTVTPAWKQHAFDSTPPKATTEPWWKRRTPPVATPTTPTPTDAAPHAWKKAEIIDTAEHAWRVWANTPAVSSHPTLSGGGVENLWARDLAGGVVDPWKRNEAAAATEDAWGPPSAEGGARWGAPVLSSFTPTVSNSAPATSAAGFAGNWPDRPANYISTPNSAARFKDRPPAPAVVADWPVHVPGEVGERAATPAVVPAWPVARTLGDGAVPSVVVEVEKRGTLTEVFARPGVGEGVQEVEFGWDMGRNAHGKAESVEAHHAPQETLSNIIMIRNCSIQSADEMARYLAVHANFEDVICENVNGAVVWYAKFADVKSAEIVRHSYELRETLSRGYGGVTFQYATTQTTVPPMWASSLLHQTTEIRYTPPPPRPDSVLSTTSQNSQKRRAPRLRAKPSDRLPSTQPVAPWFKQTAQAAEPAFHLRGGEGAAPNPSKEGFVDPWAAVKKEGAEEGWGRKPTSVMKDLSPLTPLVGLHEQSTWPQAVGSTCPPLAPQTPNPGVEHAQAEPQQPQADRSISTGDADIARADSATPTLPLAELARLSVRDDDDATTTTVPAAVADSPSQPTHSQHEDTHQPIQTPPATLQTRLKKLDISLTHIESFLSLPPSDSDFTQLPVTPGVGDAAFDEMLQGRVKRIVGAIEALAKAGAGAVREGGQQGSEEEGQGREGENKEGVAGGIVAV